MNVSATKSYESDNIIKLRELVNKMDVQNSFIINEVLRTAIMNLKRIMMKERQKIAMVTSLEGKIAAYESLSSNINTLLNNIKIN